MIKKVGLVVKSQKASLNLGREIHEYLISKGVETYFDDWSAEKIGLKERESRIQDMETDIILTLGGDGTILKTVSLISGKEIPIFGINFGTMGFLTEIRPRDWKISLDKILKGEHTIIERDKLRVSIDGEKVGDALNEAVVMTSMPVKMLHLEVLIGGQIVEMVKADGLIISTPTGSTAYSMSAGGPIIDPKVPAFIITSICPFKSRARSLVVPQDSDIRVRLLKPKKEAMVVVDGENKGKLTPGGEARFTLSEDKAYFIRLGGDFYGRIRERL
jgi:NAD+ kinase